MNDISKYDLRYVTEAYASFSLTGFEMNPNEISQKLNLTPLSVEVKGEPIELPKGGSYLSEENMWHIRSSVNSLDVNDHLKELLDRLETNEADLDESMGKSVFTVTYLNNYLYAGSGPTLESEVVARIGKFNAEIAFDIYQVDQELTEEEENAEYRRLTRDEVNEIFNGRDRNK